ncbi:MAG TPA: hypothetical protein VFV23_12220 [Verrucomicrobiae bacterium]|nr:hypothetical protein [Verrucomicrobiae bacterium]
MNRLINGGDYLMLGFDHELRRDGYAGNSCHIFLELDSAVPVDALRRRLELLAGHCPVLNARPGGLIFPHWKLPGEVVPPKVRVRRQSEGVLNQIINEPLDVKNGELTRLDLIECAGAKTTIVFTWLHALMDARSAEYFIAVVGRDELPLPAPEYIAPAVPHLPFRERLRRIAKNFQTYNRYRETPPRSPGIRNPDEKPRLMYHVEKFSDDETACVQANAVRLCGALGEAQFHAAVAAVELHRLQTRLNCPAPSYVIPVPVNLRPKGNIEPLFSNQITMLLLQFLPAQLNSVAQAVVELKKQTTCAMRDGIVEGGVLFLNSLRVLPLPVYMAFARFGLKGEICSLFCGNTSAVNPQVTTFLGAPIEEFTHVAAVPPSPGIGVIFFQFHGELRLTVLHLTKTLSENEAAEFASALRSRLLNPDD